MERNPEIEQLIGREHPCLNHGFVRLVDYMGSDNAVVQAARVSYGEGTKKVREDRGLIRYLLRHQHTTPFEMVEFKFHCKMPIFVARQWIRHRTASVNEYSLRYSKAINEFYVPKGSDLKIQTTKNKQGRADESIPPEEQEKVLQLLQQGAEQAWSGYEALMETGLTREVSRINLPMSLYTEWYWKIDLHNLMHFLKLRIDEHAQYEIRVYAQAMADIVRKIVPITWEAFEDYVLYANNFSKAELQILGKLLKQLPENTDWDELMDSEKMSKREKSEFIDKINEIRENM